jgi:lipoprotein-anchoring transpeptidase ErfK/SrfK
MSARVSRRTALLATATAALCALPAAAVAAPGDPLAPGVIADNVRVGGVDVSGLTRAQATALVLKERVAPRRAPLVLTFKGTRTSIDPVAAGYRADVAYAVKGAMLFGRGKAQPTRPVNVPLREQVSEKRIRAIIAARAERLDRPARDAAVSLAGGRPVVRRAEFGWTVDQDRAAALVRTAILTRRFAKYAVPAVRSVPEVRSIGTVVVINRGEFKLRLFQGEKRVRTYPVAVGTSSHPTPAGSFRLIEKQVNPTWFPPDSPWAAGLGPVPPGPGNPLGTRWMGTSAPAIGIHGTPAASSIGTRASHGCIRMYIHDAEDLYRRIEVGTPVYII